jgi:ATP-dependent protease HslVU (ClpYQ) peptidase subunit
MTTIAFKDGIMAADTQQMGAYIDRIEAIKVRMLASHNRQILIGLAGDPANLILFCKWYSNGCKDKDKFEMGNNEVLFYDGIDLLHYSSKFVGVQVGEFGAIGSGAEYAMGAMMNGASAEDAVEIACALDNNSGLPVKTWSKNEHI